jgi:hypothetical protein
MTDEQPNSDPGGPPSWSPPVPGSSWAPGHGPVPAAEPVVEVDVDMQPPASPGRGKRFAAIGAVVALGAAGTFAVASIAGGDDGGGATPTEAVERLIAAINAEDALGAMDLVLPGERRTLKQPMIDMVAELQRLEVLSDDASLGGVVGADVEIELDDIDLDEVADDIVNVELEGDAAIEVDGESLPLGDFVIDDLLDGEGPEGTETAEASFGGRDGDEIRFTTVRKDGRWYVSLAYTVAELARAELDADVPDPEDAIEPRGGDSPEDAADALLAAITELDLEGALALLHPDEFDALHRYAPLFLDDLQDDLDDLSSDIEIEISDVSYDVEDRGDGAAAVGLAAFTARAGADGEEASAEWDGECLEVSFEGERHEGCLDDAVSLDELGGLEGDDQLPGLLGSIASGLADAHPLQLARVDGKWYISVIGSALDGMVEGLRGLEPDDLDGGLEELTDVLDGGLGDVFGTDDGFTDDEFTDDEFTDDEFTDDVFGEFDECYQTADANEAAACFEAAVAAGADASSVPAAMRFPECGFAEAWWNFGTFDEMSDADFIALVTDAGACFQGLVDAGTISEFEVPYDLTDPSCYGGVNPYALEGDAYSEAFDAYSECILE